MKYYRQKRSNRRGAVLIEFAFTAPILFLLLFGSWEFSRANMLRNLARSAAYEGARAGIVPGATVKEVQDNAQAVLNAVGVRGARIAVSPSTITSTTTSVTVDIEIPVNSNTYVVPFFFRDKAMTSSCVMTREDSLKSIVP
ncbi:MAG: pilus assembly protein [Pirellulales bacterium]|nr:pilus assembly protein [Pirellulales bacterium]